MTEFSKRDAWGCRVPQYPGSHQSVGVFVPGFQRLGLEEPNLSDGWRSGDTGGVGTKPRNPGESFTLEAGGDGSDGPFGRRVARRHPTPSTLHVGIPRGIPQNIQ